MGRYNEKYWDAGPVIHLPGNDEELYGCEITDSETGLVGSTHRARSSKTKAYDDAWEDLMQKQKDFYEAPKPNYRESSSESSYTPSSSDQSGCTTAILWLVGIGVAVFVAIWLAVNVVLPVALLNSALALTVLTVTFKRYKTLFAALALVGGGYMMLDITNGWLSSIFVDKVVKDPIWIGVFVYINAFAIGKSVWFLVQPIWTKAQQIGPTEKRKGILLKTAIILLVAIGTLAAPTMYHTIQNRFTQTTLRFNNITYLSHGNNEVIDTDGNHYHTINVGSQVWMVENLRTTKYNDGTTIPLISDNAQWDKLVTPGYGWPNNDISNKYAYGALYNWYTVNTGKLAPRGWHVPTDSEWTILITFLGGDHVAGAKLKETGTSHWKDLNSESNNESGFSALPSGCRGGGGTYYSFGVCAEFWSSTAYNDASSAWYRDLNNTKSVGRYSNEKLFGLSIRCIKD